MRTKAISIIQLLLLVLACACDDDDGDDYGEYDDYDDTTVTTTDAADWSSSMAYATTDPFADPFYYDDPFYTGAGTFLTASNEAPIGDPERAAVIVADASEVYFTPAGCAAVERAGAELTYALSSCLGPLGRHRFDGTLRVIFSDAGDGIGFDIASEALQLDGRDAELTLQGVYRQDGSAKNVQFTAAQQFSSQSTAYDGMFEGRIDWTAGSNCIRAEATGLVSSEDTTWDVDVHDYARCANECATSGVMTITSGGEARVLTFQGEGEATLAEPDGSIADVELDCGP